VPPTQQRLGQIRADEPGSPGDQELGQTYLPTPVYSKPFERILSGS
jgi:hypothetical protein